MTPEQIAADLRDAVACMDAAKWGRDWHAASWRLLNLAAAFDKARTGLQDPTDWRYICYPDMAGPHDFIPVLVLPIPETKP